MKRMTAIITMVAVLAAGMASRSTAGDVMRVVRSVAFPGMGQLGDGAGELTNLSTVKGLGFMAVEAVLLSLTISELSKSSASARETEYDSVKYHLAQTYEDRVVQFDNWQNAYTNAGQAKTLSYAFGGAAVAWWLINVVDIIVFAPKDAKEQSFLRPILDNTVVAVNSNQARMSYTIKF